MDVSFFTRPEMKWRGLPVKEAIAKGKAKTDKIYKAAGECD